MAHKIMQPNHDIESLGNQARRILVHDFERDKIAQKKEFAGKPLAFLALRYTVQPPESPGVSRLEIEPMNTRRIDTAIMQTPINDKQDLYFRALWRNAQRVENQRIDETTSLAHVLHRQGGVFFSYKKEGMSVQTFSEQSDDEDRKTAMLDMLRIQIDMMNGGARTVGSRALNTFTLSHEFSVAHDPRVPINGSESEDWLDGHAMAMRQGLEATLVAISAMQTSNDPDRQQLRILSAKRMQYLNSLRELGFDTRQITGEILGRLEIDDPKLPD